uniref:Uncharacterized protein n=1 Tax=Anopheles dirus TaxID=7168 RepID=A0A182NFI6_9DIPT
GSRSPHHKSRKVQTAQTAAHAPNAPNVPSVTTSRTQNEIPGSRTRRPRGLGLRRRPADGVDEGQAGRPLQPRLPPCAGRGVPLVRGSRSGDRSLGSAGGRTGRLPCPDRQDVRRPCSGRAPCPVRRLPRPVGRGPRSALPRCRLLDSAPPLSGWRRTVARRPTLALCVCASFS